MKDDASIARMVAARPARSTALWLLEMARGILTPFTTGPADQIAVWSADGRDIALLRRGAAS
jgi:hypothetical protein